MPDFPNSIQDRHEQHCAWGERYEAACIREERFSAPIAVPDGPTDAEIDLELAPARTAAALAAWQVLLADDPDMLSRRTAEVYRHYQALVEDEAQLRSICVEII